jgi:hypothetical protein
MAYLRIRRMTNRYRLPPGMAEPGALVRRLERVASTSLRLALEALIPGALPARGEIAIRRLRVRLRTTGHEVCGVGLAARWAAAIAHAVAAELRRAGDRAEADRAVFPDRMVAEITHLAALARGREPWWSTIVLAEHGRVPGPAEILRGWVLRAPERAPIALAEALRAAGPGLGRLLTSADGATLAEALVRTRRRRQREVTKWAASARTPGHGDPARVRDLAGRLDSTIRAAILAAPAPGVQRLLALACLLDAQPTLGVAEAREIDPAIAILRAREAGAAAGRETDARSESAPNPEARGRISPALEEPPAPADAQETANRSEGDGSEAQAASDAEGVPVGCGGLWYLIRPALGEFLPVAADDDALLAQMQALAWLVMERLVAPLPPAARAEACARERPLIEAFAGLSGSGEAMPPDLPPAVRDQAASALAAIEAMLSPGVGRYRRGFEFFYRTLPDPLAPEGVARSLADLVLRPGRLMLSQADATLHLPMDAVDLAVRRLGWDIDLGWVPILGRVLRFHYTDQHRGRVP